MKNKPALWAGVRPRDAFTALTAVINPVAYDVAFEGEFATALSLADPSFGQLSDWERVEFAALAARSFAVALLSCPHTLRNLRAGSPSPVHGEERHQLTPVINRWLRVATSTVAEDINVQRACVYQFAGAFTKALRSHNSPTEYVESRPA